MTTPFIAGILGLLAGAKLGETRDPRELIPGSPEEVRGTAATLARYGTDLEGIGQGLGHVDVPGWGGHAAHQYFDRMAADRLKWLRASDAMAAAAGALQRYAEALVWAQLQAREAIELWDRGEARTDGARAEHNAVVAAMQQQASLATTVVNRVSPVQLPQFFDPGAELRQRAEETLAHARRELDQAGEEAAAALRTYGGEAPDAPGWLSQAASVADTAIREHGLFSTEFTTTQEFDFRTGDVENKTGWKVTLAEFSHGNSVWGWEGEGETQWGNATLAGRAELNTLGYDSKANLSITSEHGLRAEAAGKAYLLHAEAEGSLEYGIAEVGGRGEVFVGAEAEGYLAAGPDGVSGKAEAFVGAKAEGEIYADVGGVGVGATGEAWVGYGAEASFTLGRNEDGTFTIGGSAGAGFKAGGKLGLEVTIDPPKIIDTAASAADALGDFAGGAVSTAGGAVDAVGGFASGAVDKVKFW